MLYICRASLSRPHWSTANPGVSEQFKKVGTYASIGLFQVGSIRRDTMHLELISQNPRNFMGLKYPLYLSQNTLVEGSKMFNASDLQILKLQPQSEKRTISESTTASEFEAGETKEVGFMVVVSFTEISSHNMGVPGSIQWSLLLWYSSMLNPLSFLCG